jgi:tetratricopeptide (TPR) repeat protein
MDWTVWAPIAAGLVAAAIIVARGRRWTPRRVVGAAQALEREGRLDEALDLLRAHHLQRAGPRSGRDPWTADVLLRIADLSYHLGKYRESIDAARGALAARITIAGYLIAKRIIRDCFLCIGMPDLADAEQREIAEFLERIGDRGGLASEWRARRFLEQGDLRRTIVELRRSIELGEGAPRYVLAGRRLELASAYASAGRFDEAASMANHVLAGRLGASQAAAAHGVLARVHAARDWLDNAADHAAAAIELAERSGDIRDRAAAYKTMAYVAICRSDFGAAIGAAETALGILAPTSADTSEVQVLLAEINRLMGRLDEAIRRLEEWLNGPPVPNPVSDRMVRSSAYLSLAGCYVMAERWDEALVALDEIPPKVAGGLGKGIARHAALRRAEAYAALGRPADAEEQLAQARALFEELPDIPVFRTERWVGEGAVKMRTGAADEAIQFLSGALGAPAPRRALARIHYCLGRTHLLAGRQDAAVEAFRAAVRAPRSAYSAMAEEALRAIDAG